MKSSSNHSRRRQPPPIVHKTLAVVSGLAVVILAVFSPIYVGASEQSTYGSGGYGNCLYGTCPLTVTSTASLAVDVMPTAGGVCTIASQDVDVLTDNTSGFTLSATTTTTTTAMVSGGDQLPASGGTAASPVTLANNTWGYRVDSSTIGTFGTGPTSAQTNAAAPSVTFAGMPASNGTPATLRSTATTANPAVTTKVWYGSCANITQPPGSYSVSVLYTAVLNN